MNINEKAKELELKALDIDARHIDPSFLIHHLEEIVDDLRNGIRQHRRIYVLRKDDDEIAKIDAETVRHLNEKANKPVQQPTYCAT